MPLPIRDLPINHVVDCALAPKNGATPVTLADIQWHAGSSALRLEPSADGLHCRVSCDPVGIVALIGQELQVGATGGGLSDWVTFRIAEAAASTAPVITSLGLTVGAPFLP